MGPLAALLLQAAAGPVLPAPPRVRRDPAPCPAADGDDVVVCAPDQSAYRLGPPPRAAAAMAALPPARARLGRRTTLSAEGEQAAVAGAPSNRAMVRLRVGF